MSRRIHLVLAMVAGACALTAQSLDECRSARKHGKVPAANACFERLEGSATPAIRAEALWAMNDYNGANDAFRAAVAQAPNSADVRVRWGRMFLERAQPADAATLFQEALKIQADHAGANLGLALTAAERFATGASEYAEKALKADPKLVEAQELLARIALEDNNTSKAVAEADKAIAMSPEALDALAIRATVDFMADKPSSPWMDRVMAINPVYGRAWETVGHFMVINRRYDDGIRAYRKALELDPTLWSARSELGVNLMRLGEEAEARQLLEKVFNDGLSTEPVRNTLKLLDSYKRYETFRTPRTVLRLDRKEAALLRPYFQAELDRAIDTYERKYKTHVAKPIQIEVYPNHEDFAVRTMGMPGLGALGVTFGTVVAMDSPSGRRPGDWHWASTMWHELSHVYVLAATNHRVPRWFTEGLAVHEETAVSPDWGDRLSPDVIEAIADKKLLPVAELDRGFVHPSYRQQVIVSYFQAGKICDYINEKWGYDRLLDMMHAFAGNLETATVVEQKLGVKPEEFDRQFLAWLDAKVGRTVVAYKGWREKMSTAAREYQAKRWDAVIEMVTPLRDQYAEYVEHNSAYEMLAKAYLEKGDKAKARHELELYAKVGGRNPDALKQLATLQEQDGDKAAAAATLNKLNFIYTLDENLHQRLGALYLDLKNYPGAIRELEAVVNFKPIDPAGAHFALARAYHAAGDSEKAKDQVFLSLEAAPGFKPAQKLLLELEGKD